MTDDMEPLQPLTPQQQDEFEHRRESATVVQHKCRQCGAWYETPKRNGEYVEAFACDCGNPITFTVPAIDIRAAVSFDISDPDQKLDTGMTVREAIANACYWWGKTGRHAMKRHGIAEAVSSLDPDDQNYIPSGIVNGEPWDVLNNRERAFIVKAWHHHFVRKPQTIGGSDNA